LVCGTSVLHLGMAEMIDEIVGRKVLPYQD
jgi:hypothetical protein